LHKKDEKIFGKYSSVMQDVPCRAMFLKWVQWHNNAVQTTDDALRIPSLTVFYEDYANDFQAIKSTIFDFLELKDVHNTTEFQRGKTYRGYFSRDERKQIMDLIQHFAIDEVWKEARRYVDKVDRENNQGSNIGKYVDEGAVTNSH